MCGKSRWPGESDLARKFCPRHYPAIILNIIAQKDTKRETEFPCDIGRGWNEELGLKGSGRGHIQGPMVWTC